MAEMKLAMIDDMKLNPGLITDTERTRFLNRALLDVSDLNLFEKEASLVALNGVITLPDDFMNLIYIKHPTTGRYLKAIRRPDTILSGDNAIAYVQDADSLQLIPSVLGNVTYTVSYVYRLPALVLETDQPDLPNGYGDMLIDFAVALCHRKNGNMGIYREYMGMYNVGKFSLATELTRKLNTKVSVVQNSDNIGTTVYNPFNSIDF